MDLSKKIIALFLLIIMISNIGFAQELSLNEENTWKKANQTKYYETYIVNFPDGKYINLSKQRQEEIDYRQAKRFKKATFYIQKYPNGIYYDKIVKISSQKKDLKKGNFSKITFSKNSINFFYENTSVNILSENLNKMLEKKFYKIENGNLIHGTYGKMPNQLINEPFAGRTTYQITVNQDNNRELYEFSIIQDNDKFIILNIKNKMTGFYACLFTGLLGVIMSVLATENSYQHFIDTIYQANL